MSASSGRTAAASAVSPNHETLRRVTAAVVILAMLLVGFLPMLPRFIHLVIIPDFTMLWTGGHFGLHSPSLVYDVDAMTAAQQTLRARAKAGPLPFIYPPTTLFVLVPFALVPFWPAYVLWTIAGAVAFWTAALDYVAREGDDDTLALLRPRSGSGPNVSLDRVGSTVQIPPRIHLDLYAEDQAAEVARLKALGATEVHWDKRPADADYVIMADPEGNRFCVIDAG